MAQTFDTLEAAHKLEAAGICLATLAGTLFTAVQVDDLAARLAP